MNVSNRSVLHTAFALCVTSILAGCQQLVDPGIECLQSFASELKDPQSGLVISFDNGTLIYTATNSYGARTQGKALCKQQSDGKWQRDSSEERLLIWREAAERISIYNHCRESKGTLDMCAGDSFALKYHSGKPSLTNEIIKEVTRDLGF